MGSSSSKNRNINPSVRLLPREPLQEKFNIPEVEPNYPPAKIPGTPKKDIYNPRDNRDIYFHAVRAPKDIEDSWEDLVHYLTSIYRTDMMKVRSIFTWLGIQAIEEENFFFVSTPTDLEDITPRGYKKVIKARNGSYATLFALLCRKAGLKCVVINGISKGFGYDVGIKDVGNLRDRWNAVYIEGWRLVHPMLAYKSIMSSKIGMWTFDDTQVINVEDDGELGDEDLRKVKHTFNEYFFLVSPSELINFCLPDTKKWQLTQTTISLEKWLELPLLGNKYHIDKFKFSGEIKCPLEAKIGFSGVSIKAPDKTYQLSYDLFYNIMKQAIDVEDIIYLRQYVLMARNSKENKWYFEIRLPLAGSYRIAIYGGSAYKTKLSWVGDVGLECINPSKSIVPYPDCPKIGFGPVHVTELAGLVEPSHTNGILFVKPRQEVHLTFKITQTMQYKATIVGKNVKPSEMDKWVRATSNNQSKVNTLDVVVQLLVEGEYGVRIFAKNKGASRSKWRNVCNYFLSTDRPRANGETVKDKGYKTALEINARKALEEASKGKNLFELKSAVMQFQSQGLHEVDGSFGKASYKMEYLELSKALKDAINRRHVDFLIRAIDDAEASDHAPKLQPQIDQAKVELENLSRMNAFMHDVLEMKQSTISELTSYTKPQPVIHGVLTATLVMLGEKRAHLEKWENVTKIFRQLGKDSVMRRVKDFKMTSLTPAAVQEIAEIISRYDEDTVRAASAGAATFYLWTKNVVDELTEGGQQESVV